MPLQIQSAFIGAIVTVAVMLAVLLRRRGRRTDLLFSVLCVNLIGWFVASLLAAAIHAPWVARLELAVACLLPTALLRLFSGLMPASAGRARRLLYTVYPVSALCAVTALFLGSHLIVQATTLGFVVFTILWGSRELTLASGDTPGTVEHARRRYLAIGASVVAVVCVFLETPWFKGSTTAIAHLTAMTYIFFLSQVILRDRLLDLNEFLGRMAVLGILTILFAGISALLINLGNSPSTRLFNAVFSVVVLLTLYEPLKDRLERRVAAMFFREQHRFVQSLAELRQRMQYGVLDPREMSEIVVDALHHSRRATHVAVYVLDAAGRGFELYASRGPEPAPRVDGTELAELHQLIHEARRPLVAEALPTPSDEASPELQLRNASLRAVSADVLLPFSAEESVLGFLALRDDRAAEPYAAIEVAALETIARTATTVIWNSKLAERLRERERLAAIGAMAAGLAHEIRNPLGAIKGAAQYIDPSHFGAAEDVELLDVIVEETDRLNAVVSQFLDYARPFRAQMTDMDLNEVARKTVTLIEAGGRGADRIELDLDPDLPTVRADREQMKQVILNLLLNALEASDGVPSTGSGEPAGRRDQVTLRTRHRRQEVELVVIDHGAGIPPEDLPRVFIPFFTTKQAGTGLGLAVCQRIVMNHGGTIRPRSSVGVGTEFSVVLPTSPPRDIRSPSEAPRAAPTEEPLAS
jgi:two-component system sensor histidine kinase HydH